MIRTDTHNAPRALWHVEPGRAEIRPAREGEGDVLARARWSLISRGTERLVHLGRVPASEHERMRAPFQEGDFPFPVKYGYAMVSEVLEGPPSLTGRRIFSLHPHQTLFRLSEADAIPIPDDLPSRRATLAANMETALNALWDSGAGPGDRIAVIGGGLIGCLVAWLASRLPGAEVILKDPEPSRAAFAALCNIEFTNHQIAGHEFDIAIHTSASEAGLKEAVGCLGPEGRLVELSWYGEGEVSLPLGGAFHSRRLQIISSQVGQVSPSRRPRWSYRRRLGKALDLLRDPALDALIDTEVAFCALPEKLPGLLEKGAPGIAAVISYK